MEFSMDTLQMAGVAAATALIFGGFVRLIGSNTLASGLGLVVRFFIRRRLQAGLGATGLSLVGGALAFIWQNPQSVASLIPGV